MNQQFPSFHLEDKVNLEPRGVVRPPIVHTYKRKDERVNVQAANDEGMMEKDRASGAHGQERENEV